MHRRRHQVILRCENDRSEESPKAKLYDKRCVCEVYFASVVDCSEGRRRAFEAWWHVLPQLAFSEPFPERMFRDILPALVIIGRMYRMLSITTDEWRENKKILDEKESDWS